MKQHIMRRRTALSMLIAIPLALAATQSGAADLKVLGAGPVEHTFKELAAAFTQATGHKVEGSFDTVGVIEGKLKAGEKADVIILSVASMEAMTKAGSPVAGSSVWRLRMRSTRRRFSYAVATRWHRQSPTAASKSATPI